MTLLSEPLQFSSDDTATGGVGHVTLVGAGPATLICSPSKAANALRNATLVLYDNPRLQGRARAGCRPRPTTVTSAGQYTASLSPDRHHRADGAPGQKGGRRLLRLKYGDPMYSAAAARKRRGLVAAGIPFRRDPGISAAQGAAAASGIPPTHRDHAEALVLATGHLRGEADARTVDLDWFQLARPRQTVVIYMGVATAGDQRAAAGARAERRHAGSHHRARHAAAGQRTIVGTLATLPEIARTHDVRAGADHDRHRGVAARRARRTRFGRHRLPLTVGGSQSGSGRSRRAVSGHTAHRRHLPLPPPQRAAPASGWAWPAESPA